MSGSHEKLPRLFWVQIVLVLIVGVLYLFAPTPQGHGEANAETPEQKQMITALEPIGKVALKEEAAAPGAARSGEEIVTKTCAVCHSIGLANAPKLDDSAKGDWEARLAGGMDALVQSAITGKGGMPPRGGDPTITDEEMHDAIVNMLTSSGVEVAAASDAAQEEAVEAETPKSEVAQTVVETKSEATTSNDSDVSVASVQSTKEGESTYKAACFACHDTGVANAPVIGDKVAWSSRLELGMSALYKTAVDGDAAKPTMPAKGGNPSLSDEAVKAAVDHMVAQSR